MSKVLAALGCALILSSAGPPSGLRSDWPGYEGGQASHHYSTLRDINRRNVARLSPAWAYELGNTDSSAEPLVLPDRLIVVGKEGAIAALHPGTGAELWRTNTGLNLSSLRGFSYWRSRDGTQQRVIFASGTQMRAIDPITGKIIPDFDVDLRQGLGRDPAKIIRIAPTTPGRVFEDLIIVGSLTSEGFDAPPGHVRAYDVLTGKLAWTFETIPGPGKVGSETWPADAWKTVGGANVWGGMSIDDARGIAYFVTGSPTYDFYGADRKGDNLYGNSIVAVDARTGRRLWHFQTVHHDLWDYDMVASPVLMTIRNGGRSIPAVAVAGKTGYLYVFDRVTGKPVWPIPERPVPASDAPGEHASPTQPIPSWPLPFALQRFTADDLDPELSAEDRAMALKRLQGTRNEGIFTPPSLAGSVQMPGNHGGANWGWSGADLAAGRFYVLSENVPAVLKLSESGSSEMFDLIARARGLGAAVYAANCQVCHGADREGQPPAIPSLQKVGDRLSRDEIAKIIREGRAQMPGFAQLEAKDFQGLITYLTGGLTPRPGGAVPSAPAAASKPQSSQSGRSIRYTSSLGYMLAKSGQPVIKPPWQTLTAYDLNSGKRLWQIPVGTVPGRKSPTGSVASMNGMLVTAGGLVLVASEADRKLHAYDSITGNELWSHQLPARPRGNLVTYRYKGRQYIIAPAANSMGVSFSEIPSSFDAGRNSYVAFALDGADSKRK